jgi:hypothetical protein
MDVFHIVLYVRERERDVSLVVSSDMADVMHFVARIQIMVVLCYWFLNTYCMYVYMLLVELPLMRKGVGPTPCSLVR